MYSWYYCTATLQLWQSSTILSRRGNTKKLRWCADILEMTTACSDRNSTPTSAEELYTTTVVVAVFIGQLCPNLSLRLHLSRNSIWCTILSMIVQNSNCKPLRRVSALLYQYRRVSSKPPNTNLSNLHQILVQNKLCSRWSPGLVHSWKATMIVEWAASPGQPWYQHQREGCCCHLLATQHCGTTFLLYSMYALHILLLYTRGYHTALWTTHCHLPIPYRTE